MAVTVANVVQFGTGSFGTSITYTGYTVPAGANKRLLVSVVLFSSTNGDSPPTSVTHNGVSMTLVAVSNTRPSPDVTSGATMSSNTSLWELILGSATPTGDIVVTGVDRFIVVATTLLGVSQDANPWTIATSRGLSTSVSVAATTDFVLSVIGNNGQREPSFNSTLTNPSGLTNIAVGGAYIGNSNGYSTSNSTDYITSPSVGTNTVTYTGSQSAAPRSYTILAVLQAAAAAGITATASPSIAATGSASAKSIYSANSSPVIVATGNASAKSIYSANSSAVIVATGSASAKSINIGTGSPVIIAIGAANASVLGAGIIATASPSIIMIGASSAISINAANSSVSIITSSSANAKSIDIGIASTQIIILSNASANSVLDASINSQIIVLASVEGYSGELTIATTPISRRVISSNASRSAVSIGASRTTISLSASRRIISSR